LDHTITDDDVAQLQGELAEVARDTARLLLQADYAESDLLELDARAWELRARIRGAAIRKTSEPELRVASIRSGGGLVSGG
jgi:hypothetical protein